MARKKALYRLPSFGRMEYRGIVLRAVAIYLGLVAGVAWILAQRLARLAGYDAALGEPWLVLPERWVPASLFVAVLASLGAVAVLFVRGRRGLAIPLALGAGVAVALAAEPLYTPAHFVLWAWKFRAMPGFEDYFATRMSALGVLAGLGAIGLVGFLTVRASGFRERPDTHGSARWADGRDVKKAGLLDGKGGLLVGLWEERGRPRYLRHDGPEHLFVFAPTRTGKGVGLVLPNLLSWPGSVLVHDIKGENWALSAGWRKKVLGSLCLRFDPTDAEGTSARYNPLFEIRQGVHEVRDTQNVADILIDPNGDRVRDHWDRTAHALLVGVILHVLYKEPDKSLRGCANLLTNPGQPVEKTLLSMMATRHDPEGRMGWIDPNSGEPTTTHPVVARAARAILDKSENERSGVLSTALTFLDLYRDPVLAANTDTSDFTISDLTQAERPVSLYLTVPASDLSRTRPLLRMILNQALRRLTEAMNFESGRGLPVGRHPLLLMLDEFPALGRLAFFQESLAYLAGYGIRAVLITQDLSQHYGVYGREESITGNCHVRVAFTANKPETADLLSRMAGEMTVHMEQRSFRGSRFDLVLNSQNISQQQTKRRLLTPDEAMRLPPEDALVFVAGHPPIRATKIRYFEDEVLSARAGVPPPSVSDQIQPQHGLWVEDEEPLELTPLEPS